MATHNTRSFVQFISVDVKKNVAFKFVSVFNEYQLSSGQFSIQYSYFLL